MKYSCILFLILFAACVKDKPQPVSQPSVQLSTAKKVYVVNEGPFVPGENGSVSLYDTGNKAVVENFYFLQNQSHPGNVAQSLNAIHGSYYLVMNNANKIIVCDNQLKKKAEITGLTSPRYILGVTNQKAYVSDLYANAIRVVNLNSNTPTGHIPCHGKTERMVLLYNKVFVTNTDRDYVYVINTLNDKISDSVWVGRGASSLVIDKNDKLWVLASGNAPLLAGKLSRIDPLTHAVELALDFPLNDLPGNLCMDGKRETLYFLNADLFRMAVTDQALPGSAFIGKGTRNFYGLGVNPNDNSIYVADALDYQQPSQIYVYNADGSSRHTFKAGIISNSFYFE